MIKKGIILAGGAGTRMSPLTKAVNKQLLPLYDKPLFFYPLSILMLANIQEILIISNPDDIKLLEKTFKNGSALGLKLSYEVQKKPEGLAQAFIIGEKFLNGSPSALVLGDNLLFGQNLTQILEKTNKRKKGATIFGYKVKNPKNFGVIDFDKKKKKLNL